MFPPKPSNDPNEWLSGLWQSLRRAGDHFDNQGDWDYDVKGRVIVQARLNSELPKGAKTFASNFIKQYAEASGWNASVSFNRRGYVRLIASSRAASKASKNL